jgi:hypothetical protein
VLANPSISFHTDFSPQAGWMGDCSDAAHALAEILQADQQLLGRTTAAAAFLGRTFPQQISAGFLHKVLVHSLLSWASIRIWPHALQLAGEPVAQAALDLYLPNGGSLQLDAAGGVGPQLQQRYEPLEVEHALQLAHFAFVRAFRGQGQSRQLEQAIAKLARDLERDFTGQDGSGSGAISAHCLQVVRAAVVLGLGMGAAHPELRALLPAPGSSFDASVMRRVGRVKEGRVYFCERPGWVYHSSRQAQYRAEVVLVA